MEGISFHRCLLNNLVLNSSRLVDIDFRSAEMRNSNFSSTVFDKSKLIMVDGKNSKYDKCSFIGSVLLHSDFSGSSFRFANLSESVVNDVRFVNCDLRGADFSCKGMETCVLDGAIYDETTIWNKDFIVSEHGAIKMERIR